MKTLPIKFSAKIWLYPGDAAWHFITVPEDESEMIKEMYIWPRRGFGAIPVNVTIGQTKWKTSVFPEKKGTYILPIKKEVRLKEGLSSGSSANITLEVLN
jgi:hypothetical protein